MVVVSGPVSPQEHPTAFDRPSFGPGPVKINDV